MIDGWNRDRFTLVLIMPTDLELEGGVEHIVHDYSTLVLTGEAIPKGVIPVPWNGPAEQSFIISCRKFVDFFRTKNKFERDMLAKDYVGPFITFDFPAWSDEQWAAHHNTHLFHLSYGRVDKNQRKWDGYRENKLFYQEIQVAWRKFLAVPPSF